MFLFFRAQLVDFNEEFSAFHARTLEDQSHFVVHAISYIHSLYQEQPPEIMLLGHSMGGIVAKYAMVLSTTHYDRAAQDVLSSVPVIVTMSTPHLNPPVTLDDGFDRIYKATDRYWDDLRPSNVTPPMLLSICGGSADTQIPSDSCGIAPSGDSGSFAVFTSGIDVVWTPVEHQAIVWCDQVRWRVARMLLDMSKGASRESQTKVAREWLLGETSRSASGGVARLPASSLAHAKAASPVNPTISTSAAAGETFVARVPEAAGAMSLQILACATVDGVGPSDASSLRIEVCEQPYQHGEIKCAGLAGDVVRHLPPSPPKGAGDLHLYPRQGSGAQSDEGFVYLEAELPPTSVSRIVRAKLDGPGWASVGFVEGDQPLGLERWRPIRRQWNPRNIVDNAVLAHDVHLSRRPGCQRESPDTFAHPRAECFAASAFFAPLFARQSSGRSAHEVTYYTQVQDTVLMHAHSTNSPVLPTGLQASAAMQLDLWQDPADDCRIEDLRVTTRWSSLPGLGLLRFRLLLMQWTIALSLLIWRRHINRWRKDGTPASLLIAFEDSLRADLPMLALALPIVNVAQIALFGSSMVGVPHWKLFWLPLPLVCTSSGIVGVLVLAIDKGISILSRVASRVVHFTTPHQFSGCTTCALLVIAVAFGLPAEVASVLGVGRLACAVIRNASLQDRAAYNISATYLLVMIAFLPLHAGATLVWVRHIVFQLQNAPTGFQARFASEDLATRLAQVGRLVTMLPFFTAAQGDLRASSNQWPAALTVADKLLLALAVWGFWGQGGRVGSLAQVLWLGWVCVVLAAISLAFWRKRP